MSDKKTRRARYHAGHQGALREGFTTGSAAAAAAKAAAILLLQGRRASIVDVPLPESGRLTITIERCVCVPAGAQACVVKDGGDDPDVTHQALICCQARHDPTGAPGTITLEGGTGVGRVTRPGLPVPVGEPAINPAPRRQIIAAVHEVTAATGHAGALTIEVSVPNGEHLARHTLNPRLGITGGISILGTRGTVRPYSHEAYEAVIREALNVAWANGLHCVGLSTGRRSERLLQRELPELPEFGFIQAADLFRFTLQEAVARGFRHLIWGCFFGKLVKMAQGCASTHAKASAIDFARLAARWAACGLDPATSQAVAKANTARHACELIETHPHRRAWVETLACDAVHQAKIWTGQEVRVEFCVFDFQETLLCRK